MKTLTKLICMLTLLWLNAGTVAAQCTAAFMHNQDSLKRKDIQFANNSTGNQLGYLWNFGDGTTSDMQNPKHSYANYGAYNVCLYTYSKVDTTCKSTTCDSVHVFDNTPPPPPACQAYFYAENDTTGNPNLVHVKNNSQGNALSYTWNFGDGSPLAKGFDPHHQYAAHGTYNICLSITSGTDTSCHSQYCVNITTQDSIAPPPPPAPCQAYFYAYNDSVTGNLVYVQNNSQGNALSYTWNFGDGSPLAKGFDPHHQYAAHGTYNICLNITSGTDTSCHSQYCVNITTQDSVTPPPPAPCQAYFYAINDTVTGNLVHVQNHSQGNALSYTWNFGDGSPLAKGFDPHHQYTAKGTYNICLSVISSTDTSCHSQYCVNITTQDTVTPPPPPAGCQAYFHAFNDTVTGNLVHVQNISQGNALSYTWNFGDGSPLAKGFDPHHQYAVQGTYNICLSITSGTDTSCHSTLCDTITTNNLSPVPCNAMFYAENDSVNSNKVFFYNTSSGNSLKYEWNFGDGKISHDANPSHEYTAIGAYTVCLHVSSLKDTSCHSAFCSEVHVKNPANSCKANFYTYVSAGNLNEIHVKYLPGTGGTYTYMINYGDGSSTNSLTHTYAQSGNYSICLTVTNNNGCTDTKCMPVTVGSCKAGFYLYKDSLDSHSYHAVNTSWGHNIHYTWSFGDGTTSNSELPAHVYQNYGKYCVCVNVNDSMGCSDDFCDSIIVTAKTNGQISLDVVAPDGAATAITNVRSLSGASLYPNPVINAAHLAISSVNDDNVKISIINVLGQVSSLQTYKLLKGTNDVQLNVADLPEGIYYLVITSTNNAQQLSLKFVK